LIVSIGCVLFFLQSLLYYELWRHLAQKFRKGAIGIEQIRLIIDNGVLEEYEKHYFTLHPKAKKKPIENPWHPSINKWMIMKRPMMNALKQRVKAFMVWFIEYSGYANKEIKECEMVFTTYYKTRSRHDLDNSVPKFYLDGMVACGFISDDDSEHIKSLTLKCGYDKDNPRTEIEVKL